MRQIESGRELARRAGCAAGGAALLIILAALLVVARRRKGSKVNVAAAKAVAPEEADHAPDVTRVEPLQTHREDAHPHQA